jgi:hypothetical protein
MAVILLKQMQYTHFHLKVRIYASKIDGDQVNFLFRAWFTASSKTDDATTPSSTLALVELNYSGITNTIFYTCVYHEYSKS